MSEEGEQVEAARPMVYSVALEQQVRLIRALLSPAGASLVAEDLFGILGQKLAELGLDRACAARHNGQALRETRYGSIAPSTAA